MSRRDPAASTAPTAGVSLWLKLGVTFGLLFGGFVLLLGWTTLEDEFTRIESERHARMLGLAQTAAATFDADELRTFRRKADMERPAYRDALARLRMVRDSNDLDWAGIYGRDGDRTYHLFDADDEAPLPINYPVFEHWPPMEQAFAGTPALGLSLEDEYGRWDSAFAPIFDDDGEVAAVICLDLDADWHQEVMRRQLREVGMFLVLGAALVLLASFGFSRLMVRHLHSLADAARSVAAGDLEVHLDIRSRDEVGIAAHAFNEMIAGLKERNLIRDAFGRYVNEEIASQILSDPAALRPGGELRQITILMSDLRGFTSLSEQLPPAEMVALLNDYLGRMAGTVEKHQGTIIEFVGDAILAVFGAPVQRPDDPARAVACAVEMQVELSVFNRERIREDLPPLEMGIGVHTGEAIVGNIGSETRTKYGLVGDDVNLAGRIESFTVGGEVLVSEETRAAAGERATFRGPIAVRPKGKREPIHLWAAVSADDLQVPFEVADDAPLPEATGEVHCWRVEGKSVAAEALDGQLVRLGSQRAHVVFDEALHQFENVRLRIDTGSQLFEDVYAKVGRVSEVPGGHLCRLRFTSMRHQDRTRLATPAPATRV